MFALGALFCRELNTIKATDKVLLLRQLLKEHPSLEELELPLQLAHALNDTFRTEPAYQAFIEQLLAQKTALTPEPEPQKLSLLGLYF